MPTTSATGRTRRSNRLTHQVERRQRDIPLPPLVSDDANASAHRRRFATLPPMDRSDDQGELDKLGEELRQQVGGEFRRIAEEDEYAAAKAQLRSRTLEHVAFELLSRGDSIAVTIGPDLLHGTVVHAKGDLLVLETLQGDRVDVHLGRLVAIHVLDRTSQGGRARDRFGAGSFVARLRELELDEMPVAVAAPSAGGVVMGVIEAVTSDHVTVRDAETGHWYLPLDAIASVTVP